MKLKFFELRSLKTRVTLLTLFLFVISIWSVAFYASRVLREDMQLMLGEQQFSTVTGIANEIDGHLSNRMQALETIAKEVTPKNLGNTAALQALLEQRPLLQLLFNGGVFITRTDGIAIADVPVSAGRIGTNYLDRKSVSVPLKEGKTVIGRPAMGKKLGTPIFSITAPIFDDKAQVIGVIVGTINLDKPNFLDQITQTRYGKTGGYLLFAPQHQLIVTASDRTRVMQPAPTPGVNTMYDRYTRGYEGFGTAVSSRGVLELSSAKRIPVAGWLIVAVLPTKEAFAPVDRMLQRLFASTGAATVLAGVLAWWLTALLLRKQLAPMLEASRAIAIQTNSDQPAQHLPVVRQDEIGELIGDFNRLLGTLKQRENALQKSEQNLATTLNSIGDAVIATDPTGRVTRMNPAAEHLTGWVQHEATGRPLIDVFHIINASTRKPVADPVQLVMEQGQVVGLADHTVLLAKGGQEYQVADSAAPIRNAADEIVGVVLVFSDVTEKYLAEQSLREAQLFSDKLLDSLPGIFYLYTYPEIELVRWNKQHEILLGYGTDEMKGRLATDWFSPEVKGAVAEAIHGVMEKGSDSIEAPMVAKDGHLVPLFLTGVRLELQGRSYFVGTGTDISERKQAEIELAQSKALFEGIFNSIPDAIVYANKERQVTAINPAFTSIFGFCLDDLAGKQTAFFYESQAEYERQGQLRFNLTAAAQSLPYEVNYRRKNGSLFPGETLGTVIKTAAGDVLGYIGVIRDIAERKQAESTLQTSEKRFRMLFEGAPDPMVLYDVDQNLFVDCNPAAERLFGYSRDEILTFGPERLYPIEQFNGKSPREFVKKTSLRVIDGEEVKLNRTIRTSQGHNIVCDLHIAPMSATSRRLVLGSYIDITERKVAADKIEHLAFYDSLTDLPNRRLMLDRLGQALIASNRTAEFGALMILDLDDFKVINDTMGHDVGDRLLIEVAQRIAASIRPEDTVSRLGGDEYVVMVEGLGSDETLAASRAEMIAEKIRIALNQPYALHLGGQAHRSTPSIGVTLFRGTENAADVLFKQADMALYQAKGEGRNTVRFFNPAMQTAIESRSRMEAALRNGLKNGEFQLHYQPKVNQERHTRGAEALLRWMSADQGPVSPVDFIPLAESTGLIIPLGLWVMQTACAQLKAWSASPATRDLQISINVSARQFHEADFVGQVFDCLKQSGANPKLLKLELTESVVLRNVEEVITRMLQIRALGVTFSLDDFGTGFSSLSYLKRLPLDEVKIDQSFVRDVTSDPNDAAIVRAIIAMSGSLGIQVIAEGVETEEQLQFLKENGCLNFQGYLFGKPKPIGEWNRLL